MVLKPLADDYPECQMQMKNGSNTHSVTRQLNHILQTPEYIKGFSSFAVQIEGLNVTDCTLDHWFFAACELHIINPRAAYTIQVNKYFEFTGNLILCEGASSNNDNGFNFDTDGVVQSSSGFLQNNPSSCAYNQLERDKLGVCGTK